MLGDSFQDRLQGKLGQTRRKNFMNWIVECISFSDLITIFDIRTEENLDKKILAALLKGDELTLQAQVDRFFVLYQVPGHDAELSFNPKF